jgi:hypothetical protein
MMNHIRTWTGEVVGLGNWFLVDPRRLATLLTLIIMVISFAAFIAYVNGLNVGPIKYAPNPPGGTGGHG